jgi:cobalamin biosynthesis protein CobT
MLTKATEVIRYIRASAGRAGLQVAFEDNNHPRHNGKTIFLPKITAKTSDRDLQKLMASVDHEVAHDRFSDFGLLKDSKIHPQSIQLFVWNALEDSRINNIEAREYGGFRENWDDCSQEIVSGILDKLKKEEDSPISRLVGGLLTWDASLSEPVFPMTGMVASRFSPDKEVQDVLSNYSRDLLACHQIHDKKIGSKATFDLAEKILKDLSKKEEFMKLVEETENEGKGKTKKEEGETEKGEPQPGSGEVKEDDSPEYKIIKIKLTKEQLDQFSTTMPENGVAMGKVGINSDPVDLTGPSVWTMTDPADFVVVDYPREQGPVKYLSRRETEEEGWVSAYNRQVGSKLVAQENFAQQVRKLIQIRARVQTEYGVKKGKLDQSRLSRICFDAPGFSERVFKRKIENKTLDAAISVLVDTSGSMSGEKFLNAYGATGLVSEVCSTLGIPLEILGFTDNSGPLMFIHKAFSDLKRHKEDLLLTFARSSKFMNDNPDGENILWAHDRLLRRKEKKRLLIVMSDGYPASSYGGSGIERFTKKVIEEIENSKEIDIYGLGLLSDSVKHYYRAHSVVNSSEEIPSKLLTLIEQRILS